MAKASRADRLARRYPLLSSVPSEQRAAIVRMALRQPLALVTIVGGGLVFLPFYLDKMFKLLGMAAETDLFLLLLKMAGTILLPLVLAVPLLTRFIMPYCIRRAMLKKGLPFDRIKPDNP